MIKLPGIIQKVISNPTFPQFIKFSFVGVANTIVSYAIYFIMLQLGFFYVVAATAGTVAGTINSYILNKLFVFKSKKKSVGEIIKFIIVYAVQYLCNIAVIHVCVAYIGISAEFAGIPAIGVGVCISFLGHKFWSFRNVKEKSVDIKDILVGYTGFVGSNLYMQHNFNGVYNSSNIKDAYGADPDLCPVPPRFASGWPAARSGAHHRGRAARQSAPRVARRLPRSTAAALGGAARVWLAGPGRRDYPRGDAPRVQLRHRLGAYREQPGSGYDAPRSGG